MAAVNYTSARFSAEDDNGRPLIGGRLFTYQNGTTTPAPTYKDEAGTILNTNPIILDARGEAVVHLQPSQVYRFVLQNRFGSLIWSQDGVTGTASSASFLDFVASLLANTGAALIGYIHNATGALRRTVLDRLRERLSVKDFGAVGNGVADDTAALTLAFSVGRRLFIPEGTYKVMGSIPLVSNTTVDCEGEIVWAQDTVAVSRIGIFKTNRGASNIRMNNMRFRNTSTFDNVIGVNVEVGRSIRMVRPVARDCGVMQTFATKPDGTVAAYADVVTDETDAAFNCSTDIHVTDMDCIGRGADKHTAAVEMTYALGWSVRGGTSKNIRFGVQWWGGDSNPAVNGAAANERKNRGGLVEGVTCDHGLAGIWGSMGVVEVIASHANYHDDVGIDPEGCNDTMISDCTASHCKNGCFAGFYYNRGVSFKNLKAFQDGSWGTILFKSYNATNAAIPEYIIDNCEWVYGGAGFGVVAFDPGLASLAYRACKSTDTLFLGATNNMGHAFIENGNRWHFTKPLTDGTVVFNFGSNHGKSLNVFDNHVTSDVFQTNPNATVFFTLQNDANAAVPTRYRRNTVENFLGPRIFSVTGASPNPGIVMSFNFNDNTMDGGLPIDNSAPGKSTMQTSGNRDYFGVLIPGQTGN